MRILIATATILLTAASAAFAHAMLDHAAPSVGATVATAPKELVLWFTQKLEPVFSSVTVQNAEGATVTAGKATIGGDGTQLHVPLKKLGPGTYRVKWHVLAVDTHRTQGDFTFSVGH